MTNAILLTYSLAQNVQRADEMGQVMSGGYQKGSPKLRQILVFVDNLDNSVMSVKCKKKKKKKCIHVHVHVCGVWL